MANVFKMFDFRSTYVIRKRVYTFGTLLVLFYRVHGVRGIRIADNSIMPEITTGHLNAPAIMIGSKAGQLILEDYSDIVTTERQEL